MLQFSRDDAANAGNFQHYIASISLGGPQTLQFVSQGDRP